MKRFSSLWQLMPSSPLKPLCGACNALCEAADAVLCDACHREAFAPRMRCVCCAVPSATTRCGACIASPPDYDATLTAASYTPLVRPLLHRFKFSEQPGLAAWMARALAPHLSTLRTDTRLVPVPLSKERLKLRGFNQSWELAKQLSALTGHAARSDVVLRIRDTPAQSTLKFKQRRESVKQAFACPARIDGLNIGVVDDVMTTGATLEEVARTLKKAGAASVTNLVIFRAAIDS